MLKLLGPTLALILAFAPQSFAQGAGQATPVVVYQVTEKAFSDEVEALGTLRANESVELTSTVTERVSKINFNDNQSVKQGDILVEMDAAEEMAELSEQESALAEAERQVKRLAPLVRQGAASESGLDTQKLQVLAARSRIKAIQSRIDQRIIKAPYDGVLGLRNISVGALAQPGTLITTIDDLSVMKLDFSVPEIFLSSLKEGTQIESTTEAYPDDVFKGAVFSVDSRIDPVTRSIQARAIIDNGDGRLKPGLLMHVTLKKNPRQALLVPEEAMIADGQDNFVFVVKGDSTEAVAERRKVTLGARQFGEVEILEGIKAGEYVVTHGIDRLRPGAAVKIRATEKDNEPLKELLQQNADQGDS